MLKVTDVQRMLRGFAQNGHDVTTNPHKAIINGKPYGLAIGHELAIYKSQDQKDNPYLSSFLLQSEAPIVTHIQSGESFKHSHPRTSSTTRDVTPLTREKRLGMYAPSPSLPHGYHVDWQFGGPGGTWEPDNVEGDPDRANYKDIHEAITSHTTGAVKPTRMTPEESKNFNEQRALSSFTSPAKPFAGLVRVRHSVGNGMHNYTYNPATEQLIRHEDTDD